MKRRILFVFMVLPIFLRGFMADHLVARPADHARGWTIPFRLHRDYLILVNCSVANRHGLTAVIDTGTTETILDLALARRLFLETRPDSAISLTEEALAEAASVPDLKLGSVQLARFEGIAMDLAPISHELGIHLDIVIGMDVLHRSNFVVDYQNHLVTIITDAAASVRSMQAMEHSAPLLPGDRFALVNSNILGEPMRLQVDTGTNGLLLYGAALNKIPHSTNTSARMAGVLEISSVRTVDSADVRIGDWHASRLALSRTENPGRKVNEFDGILGPRALGARRIAFDFTNHFLHWD